MEQTIYPYGQGGEMPADYPIADDLYTDSAQQALSARQGMLLNQNIQTLIPVDTSMISTHPRYISNDGNWVLYNDYACKNIQVSPGEKYRITAKSNTGAIYCVLSPLETFPDSLNTPSASFATGYSKGVNIPAGESADVVIPNDGAWLYIVVYTTLDKTPEVEKFALPNEVFDKLSNKLSKSSCGEIFVAAADASTEDKLAADYQCTGTNDELVIQQAVNAIYAKGGGTLRLSVGTFIIDSFPNHDNNDDGGSDTAILIPSNDTTGYEIRITGGVMRYSGADNSKGTTIRVSNSCYESLNSNSKYKIFRARYSSSLVSKAKVSLFMENIAIDLPYNQKKIMCIDLLYCNRVFIHLVTCKAYISGYNGRTVSRANPPDIAVEGCVGIRFTGGSNYGYLCEYRNLDASGFYEGFQVGGEHVVCSNLGGTFNFYTYTFGNYPWSDGFNHPITMINCSQEATVNYPLFAYCSESRNNSESGQMISIIDFNLENLPSQIPGGVFGNLAREVKPGTFHGEIIYTIQYKYGGSPMSTTMKFWEDGHGQRFQSRNSTQLLACDTTTRNSYAPNYLQRIWDTTLNKEVICTNTATKEWRDTAGNIVTND